MKAYCDDCGQPHPRCDGHKQLRSVEQEAERARRFGDRPNFEPRPIVTEPTPCGLRPVKGGTHCQKHGGGAPQVRAASQRRLMAATISAEAARLGVSVEVDPADGLEAMLYEAAGNVCYYRDRVAALPDITVEEKGPGGAYKFAAHPVVVLYNVERDRVVDISTTMIKLGLDERRVRLAEEEGDRLMAAFLAACHAVSLAADVIDALRREYAKALRPAPIGVTA